jgi:hypothetical protein
LAWVVFPLVNAEKIHEGLLSSLLLPFLLDFEVEEEPFWGPVFS